MFYILITHLEPDILECEVKWALGSITTNKASGGDGIPVELFQILEDDAVKVLHSTCQQIWKTQQWLQNWKRSVFISIPKKGNFFSVGSSSLSVSGFGPKEGRRPGAQTSSHDPTNSTHSERGKSGRPWGAKGLCPLEEPRPTSTGMCRREDWHSPGSRVQGTAFLHQVSAPASSSVLGESCPT